MITYLEVIYLNKLEMLKDLLSNFSGAVIAYSGGVDSTFLAVVAQEVLGERVLSVTAVSPTYPEHQLSEAKELAARFGINHMIITTNEFADPNFTENPPERCYYCKKSLFLQIKKIAEEKGNWVLIDGANKDDLSDYRPGHRATQELGVRSPLQELAFTKQDIRDYSKEMSLPTWDKPAYACLASRVPYGNKITPEVLKRIELAESFLTSLGLIQIRVRDHFPIARIEIGPAELDKTWQNREIISKELHRIGYPYVTLDMDGLRSGSMNEILKVIER